MAMGDGGCRSWCKVCHGSELYLLLMVKLCHGSELYSSCGSSVMVASFVLFVEASMIHAWVHVGKQ